MPAMRTPAPRERGHLTANHHRQDITDQTPPLPPPLLTRGPRVGLHRHGREGWDALQLLRDRVDNGRPAECLAKGGEGTRRR